LPFSPADLAIPPRAAPARRVDRPTVVTDPVPGAGVPAPREEPTVPVSPTAKQRTAPAAAQTSPASPAERPANGKPGAAAAARPDAKPAGPPPSAATSAAADAAAGKPRKAARPKAPATLTVTLAYSDGDWTVAAHQGAKALAKPSVVRPAEALRLVGMLDVPGIRQAVEEIVAAARTRAEAEAERLRAALAEIETRLADLRDTR